MSLLESLGRVAVGGHCDWRVPGGDGVFCGDNCPAYSTMLGNL